MTFTLPSISYVFFPSRPQEEYFDNTGGFLGNTMSRVLRLAKGGRVATTFTSSIYSYSQVLFSTKELT